MEDGGWRTEEEERAPQGGTRRRARAVAGAGQACVRMMRAFSAAHASSCACAPGEICRSFARGGSIMTIARVVPRGWLSRRVGVYGEVHLVPVHVLVAAGSGYRSASGSVRSVVSVRCLSTPRLSLGSREIGAVCAVWTVEAI